MPLAATLPPLGIQPSSVAFMLTNHCHTASQTEMRVPTVLVVRTSGSLTEVRYGVMGGPPRKAALAGALKAAVAGARFLLSASPMPTTTPEARPPAGDRLDTACGRQFLSC
jgi:hypothetical protein